MREKNRVGRLSPSQLKELQSPISSLDRQLEDEGLNRPVREYRFALEDVGREWRFDRAWPLRMVAFEYEGGTSSKDWRERLGHTSAERYRSDCEKYSWAAILGWRVIRADKDMVKDGTALSLIKRALATSE